MARELFVFLILILFLAQSVDLLIGLDDLNVEHEFGTIVIWD